MNYILDIFYNYVIKEATTGRINCLQYFNMPFSTYIYEINEKYECKFEGADQLLIPTLIIRNKHQFDELLIEYVKQALIFYDDSNFPEEFQECNYYDIDNKICKEKIILTTLWSNATIDDFKDPNQYIQRRIEFFKNKIENKELGYNYILNGKLEISITKDSILNETPYQMEITSTNEETFSFPRIKFGIQNQTAYIYAIQNKNEESNSYTKKINRSLYKIGEGFDAIVDNFETYEEGNLKDVTASFLVAANICLFYLNSLGIKEIVVPNVLIERWNAKSMAINLKAKHYKMNEEDIKKEINKQNAIWINLNEKFLRIFRRLEFHHESISITSEPFLIDSSLHLNINKIISCNNELLKSTAILAQNYEKNNEKIR